MNFEKEQCQSDREIKAKELSLREAEIALDKQKFDHQKAKEEREMDLAQKRFDLEQEERRAQIATQKLMLEILSKK